MTHRLEVIARGMLEPINLYATSILGALTLFWGLWIINPFWEVFQHADLYSRMAQFAPEWAWGTWSSTCGAIILLSLYKNSLRWLTWSFAFVSWHWWTVAMMMWWGDWQNTGGLTYSFIGAYATFIYLNLKVNKRLPEQPAL